MNVAQFKISLLIRDSLWLQMSVAELMVPLLMLLFEVPCKWVLQ